MSLRPGDRVHIHGAGAAGCSLALELSRLRPGLDVKLIEVSRVQPGAGVVMARSFFDSLSQTAPDLLDVPRTATATWDSTLTRTAGFAIESPAHGTVAFSRRVLSEHLRSLAAGRPDVTLCYEDARQVTARAPAAELVVGADGVDSWTRLEFGHRTDRGDVGRTVYVWASVPEALPAMFHMHDTGAGMVLLHAYPHARAESTVVVEALDATVESLGLLDARGRQLEEQLGRVLSGVLDSASLTCHTRTWRRFAAVRCSQWYRRAASHVPSVLIGDAAHTMHYSIGIGTTLAIQDGRALAAALAQESTLDEALARYRDERKPVADAAFAEAESSRRWFEDFIAFNRTRGAQTVFALRSRRTINTYATLAAKDRRFAHQVVDMVDYREDRATHRAIENPSRASFRYGPIDFGTRVLRRSDLDRLSPRRTRPANSVLLVGLGPDDHDGPPAAGCLAVVAASPGGDRTSRSRRATRIRRHLDLPVLYVHDGATIDELDTLIAAGCIDLAVDRWEVPESWWQASPAGRHLSEVSEPTTSSSGGVA